MPNIGTLTAHLEANTTGLTAGLMRSQQALGNFSRSVKSTLKPLAGMLALGAGVGVMAGFIGGLKKAATLGMEFEQTMATVGGVMRATSQEMEMLTAKAREMGATTEWTAKQAGDALQFLGMAGFDATKATAALPGVLDLATAANVDLGRAADIASNALTAFQLPVEQLTRVNDVFVGTMTRSNTNMEQMAEAFKYSAPVAKAFGYEIEELAGMIGKLGDSGIQSSMAGTQLAMAMQQAAKIAQDMGYKSADLLSVLKNLKDDGYTAAQMIGLFGQRAGRAAAVLFNAVDATKEFQKTLANTGGEAERLAAIMRDTVSGAYKTLVSTVQDVALGAFENFGSGLRRSIEWMTEWVRENKRAILAFVSVITTAISTVAAIIAAIADLVGGFSTGIVSAFDNIGDAAKRTADDVGDAGRAIEKALSIDPSPLQAMILWLDKIGDTIYAFAKYLVKSVGSLVGNALGAIGYFVGDVLELVYYAVRTLSSAITLQFDDVAYAWEQFTTQFTDIGKHWSGAFAAYTGTASDAWRKFRESLDPRGVQEIFAMDYAGLQRLEGLPPTAADFTPEQTIRLVFQGDTSVFDEIAAKQSAMRSTTDQTTSAVEQLIAAFDADKVIPSIASIDDALKTTKVTVDDLRSAEINMLREYLEYTDLTASQAASAWEQYKNLRIEQINAEAQAMIEAGHNAILVYQLMHKRVQNLRSEIDSGPTRTTYDASRARDAELQLLARVARENQMTADEQSAIWEQYRALRISQINDEAQRLTDMGVNAGIVYKTMQKEVAGLSDEFENLVGATEDAMDKIVEEITGSMTYVLTDFLTQELQRATGTFRGEILSIGEFWKMFWNDIMTMVARNAADEIANIIKALATTILQYLAKSVPSWLGGGPDIGAGVAEVPAMQHGGIVTRPQLVMAGEAGPEAIIPLSKFNRRGAWGAFGQGADVTNINFNVATPDIRSFKASEAQLMARAAVAIGRGRRNL